MGTDDEDSKWRLSHNAQIKMSLNSFSGGIDLVGDNNQDLAGGSRAISKRRILLNSMAS